MRETDVAPTDARRAEPDPAGEHVGTTTTGVHAVSDARAGRTAGPQREFKPCGDCAKRRDLSAAFIQSPSSVIVGAEAVIIHDPLPPGDIAVLTAALKALHEGYPGRFLTDVRTSCPALLENNPFVTPLPDADGRHITAVYDADRTSEDVPVYATINACNERPIHQVEAYCEGLARALGLPRLTPRNWLEPSITLPVTEKSWVSQIQERTGKPTRFWIVNAGIKRDYTAKRWNGFAETIARTKHHVTWVQVGAAEHDHAPIPGAINLIGRTDLRQLVRLVYHAEGVLCGVTALMHLAHWVERGPHNPFRRHAVIVAGGREPPGWFAYPGHRIFHTIGEFDCCAAGGCWRSRVEPLREFADKNGSLCVHPRGSQGLCMESIRPRDVAETVLRLAGEPPDLSNYGRRVSTDPVAAVAD